MNAPMSEHLRLALQNVALDDKYTLSHGFAFMSGVQALVKLPLMQRERDRLLGRNTAGFISGYRGSPLGSYDQALWKAKAYLKEQDIVFQPGVNEELAATAIWGTQQLGFAPAGTNKYDGVFGIWYGKGPGVDRSGDVFKHANMAGTTPWGGVVAVAGDDHISKSSTVAHQSDQIFIACGTPVFFPSNPQEILDFGLHAIALSRYAGIWSGMKTIQEVVESSARVNVDPQRVQIKMPQDFEMPVGGVHIRWPDPALDQEERLFYTKWYAALAYIRANRLNHNVIYGRVDRLGLIASGKAFNDTRQALIDLGLDDETCKQVGVRLHKVAVVWPLEAESLLEFSQGLKEILVIEEKRPVIENQVKEALYNSPIHSRPVVLGQYKEDVDDLNSGQWARKNPKEDLLIRANADLNPAIVARAIASRLKKMGIDQQIQNQIDVHLAILDAKDQTLKLLTASADRQPWFCSGCPHNTSTKVPEGSRAMAGIGCHFMSVWMDRSTVGFTQMGGEGVPWVGQQPFSHDGHVFANLGDGTYFHSGMLAVRQSIASGVNITYKILYNDAVAMTGGQPLGERPEGHSVIQIAQSMRAEGAQKIVVVTDEPIKYEGLKELPAGISVKHRDELDSVQRLFREIKGTTVIIYDQTCATEKRRRRKRGTLAEPAKRVVINELVCEGCGDCGVESNCMSVEPIETDFGRKRQVNQSTCNKDLSCLKGFCPSFVTVEGGQLKTKKLNQQIAKFDFESIPEPELVGLVSGQVWGLVVAGVGGTGVITIGQLLGVAAHLEGLGVVVQDAGGLAQKGGATWSHVLISSHQSDIRTNRVSMASADLVLGCDPVVAATAETLSRMREGRTQVAMNAYATPTAGFMQDSEWVNPGKTCLETISKSVGQAAMSSFNANEAASILMGDSIYTNPMLLGFAWQNGWMPLALASILRAFELNEVSIEKNKTAFQWGRIAAVEGEAFTSRLLPDQIVTWFQKNSWEQIVEKRVVFLTAYQNASYAESYRQLVNKVAEKEAGASGFALTEAVAKNFFKLMAYKDEYEVARLHSDGTFEAKVASMFEGDYKLNYHLAPPLLAPKNSRGELKKGVYGSYMSFVFRILAKCKVIRGSWLDIFSYTDERRHERVLIKAYRESIEELLLAFPEVKSDPARYQLALALACIPEKIKGFGHVKARHLKAAHTYWDDLLSQWRKTESKAV